MNNKQAQLFGRWNNSNDRELYHVYNNYSRAKVNAFEYCKEKQYQMHGYDGRITSHNSQVFCYGFLYDETIEETGEIIQHLYYITPYNEYDIPLYDIPYTI